MPDTPDRAIRRSGEAAIREDPRLLELARSLGISLPELMMLLASGAIDPQTGLTNEQILQGILEGDFATAEEGPGASVAPAEETPTFEELFQEQLEQQLGPDPGATFRNVFRDVFGGVVTTSFEEFIQSQFTDLQDAYITQARINAERGQEIPTFEQYLAGERRRLGRAFQFTEAGALENLQNFIEQAEGQGVNLRGQRFTQFIQENFEQLFNRFQRISDAQLRAGEETSDTFSQFLMDISPDLRQQFEFTRGGATESLQGFFDQAALRGFDLESDPFAQFQARSFERLFDEFQRATASGETLTGAEAPNTFSEFLLRRAPRTQREFSLQSPRERGQFAPGELARINPVR
jgi:hypothetical protein